MNETPHEPELADFADAFDEWIAGATVAKRSVPIYGKPGLYAEYEELERQYTKAQEMSSGQEEMAGGDLAAIEGRMVDLYHEWMESKSTWTVRAMTDDEITVLKQQEPVLVEPIEPKEPEAPADLPERHTEQQARSHTVAMNKYREAKERYAAEHDRWTAEFRRYSMELNLRGIAAATEKIEFANGKTTDGVTVEQLRSMKDRLGERQILMLVNAAQMAALTEPEIPAPFSRTNSKSDRTS